MGAAPILLTGLAIVDDMGAVAINGLFYTEQIIISSLLWAGLTLLAMLFFILPAAPFCGGSFCNQAYMQQPQVYWQ